MMEKTLSNEKVAYISKNIFIDSSYKLNIDASNACNRSGIRAADLMELSIEEISGPKELQKMRWEAYEIRRRRKLKLLWEYIKDNRGGENET
jgi:hypothetical protein